MAIEKRIVKIPYFNGSPRAMPYVKLRSLDTGVEAWFANFHNPADTSRFHRQQRFRARATGIEIRLANRLIATDVPVFITGDMNERDGYFCAMTSGAPMVAARGGTNNGGCRAEPPARRRLDLRLAGRDVHPLLRGPQPARRHHHRPPGGRLAGPDRREVPRPEDRLTGALAALRLSQGARRFRCSGSCRPSRACSPIPAIAATAPTDHGSQERTANSATTAGATAWAVVKAYW